MKDKYFVSKHRLQHIIEAINKIEEYVSGISEKKFIESDLINNAVLYQFSIIGEAIIYIENEILDKYKYQWYKVRAFRNMIAHEYFNIKLEAVWSIINNDLPELKTVIKQILENEFINI